MDTEEKKKSRYQLILVLGYVGLGAGIFTGMKDVSSGLLGMIAKFYTSPLAFIGVILLVISKLKTPKDQQTIYHKYVYPVVGTYAVLAILLVIAVMVNS